MNHAHNFVLASGASAEYIFILQMKERLSTKTAPRDELQIDSRLCNFPMAPQSQSVRPRSKNGRSRLNFPGPRVHLASFKLTRAFSANGFRLSSNNRVASR
jgi:hypothetical protein